MVSIRFAAESQTFSVWPFLSRLVRPCRASASAAVMTEASDSELVIDLINQAQVFRFLTKPLNLKLLQQHVQAALARYQPFCKSPILLKQHRITAARGSDSSVLKRCAAGFLRSNPGSAAELRL